MTLNISGPYPSLAMMSTAKSGRYLISGKDNVVELGEKIARFLSMKGYRVDEVASFDSEKGVSLCEVGVQTVASLRKVRFGVDTMICLDDESLEYESLVTKNGKVLADGSSVTRGPKRSDLYLVMVPTQLLAERIRDNWNGELDRSKLGLMSMFGGLMGVEMEHLEAGLLTRLLNTPEFHPVPPYSMAAYLGYDWVREKELMGKTPVEWTLSTAAI